MGKRSGGSTQTTSYEPTEYELDMQRMLRDYGQEQVLPTAQWSNDVAKAFALNQEDFLSTSYPELLRNAIDGIKRHPQSFLYDMDVQRAFRQIRAFRDGMDENTDVLIVSVPTASLNDLGKLKMLPIPTEVTDRIEFPWFPMEHDIGAVAMEFVDVLIKGLNGLKTASTPTTDEIYCSLVTGRIVDAAEVYVNGIRISEFESDAFYSHILRIGSFEAGEDVKVTFLCNTDKWSYLNIRFASFDTASFSEQLASVDKSKVSVNTVYDGYVKLDIKDMEAGEMVLTTIPVEDGWQLYVDGAPSDLKAYQNAFIAFDAGEGSHTAELVFTAPGLKGGAVISCVGVLALAAFIFVDKKLKKE